MYALGLHFISKHIKYLNNGSFYRLSKGKNNNKLCYCLYLYIENNVWANTSLSLSVCFFYIHSPYDTQNYYITMHEKQTPGQILIISQSINRWRCDESSLPWSTSATIATYTHAPSFAIASSPGLINKVTFDIYS